MNDELLETVERAFSETCTHARLQDAERDGWAPEMWAKIADMGLPWISVPERFGGQGGTLGEAFAVLRAAGRHGLPLPLAETGVLGGGLLAGAGISVPEGPLTVVPGRREDTLTVRVGSLSGTAHGVPWARFAEHIVVLIEVGGAPTVICVPSREVSVHPMTNMAGEPRDLIRFDEVPLASAGVAEQGVDAEWLRRRGALSRIVLCAGALERIQDLTVAYTAERHQFGQPIARFQAVQQHLVHIAEQAALLGIAADVAVRETVRGLGEFETSAAKILCGDAVQIATRAAHQAHGAMGMTQEYALHHLTRRLWSWRSEYGEGSGWARSIGSGILARGADRLFPLIADGSQELTR
jgi:acyl-CoA dehydrogenase